MCAARRGRAADWGQEAAQPRGKRRGRGQQRVARVTAPSVQKRQLGAELRRLRMARGLRLEDVAAHLGCSEGRVSRLETGNGRATLRPEELEKLCDLFQVTEERQRQMLLGMLSYALQPGWWDAYREVLPSGLEVYFGLETEAQAEHAWEPVLIHGLLQTADYARAVLSGHPGNRLHDVAALVAARTKRQELLTREDRDPLELWAILDEQVIRRPVGGPDVMRAQILHLVEVAALPNVTLQIMPVAKGVHAGLGGAFSILDFQDSDPVIYIDSPAGNLYMEKKSDVRHFGASFDLLKAEALDPDDSTALLQRVAEES